MEEFTKTEQIKLGNFKEHLAALKREVAQVNEELTTIVHKRDEQRGAFHKEKVEGDKALATLSKEIKSLHEQAEMESRKIANEREVLNRDKASFAEYSAAENESIQKERDKFLTLVKSEEKNLHDLRDGLEKIKKDISAAEKELSSLTNQIIEKSLQASVLESRVVEIAEEVYISSVAFNEDRKEKEKVIAGLEKEIARLEKEAADAGEKHKVGIESARAEQERLEQKRKQVQILINRAKKMFEKLYPGQDIDNLIKL